MRLTRTLPLAAVLLATPAAAQTPSAALGPCTGGGLPPDARCGTVQVPENRAQPGGRQLALNVVMVPARGGGPARQAMTFFGGGPGQDVAPMAGWAAQHYADLREGRDLLFVDQRGTGASAPLVCVLRDPASPQSYLDDFIPPARAAACRDSLARTADLTRYTSMDLAHDIEAVRQALGYEQLDLNGGSYGTRAALTYMRAYPTRVRSAVLVGVVPFGFLQPAGYAATTDAALAGILAECGADAACNAAFPNVEQEMRAVAARIQQAPAEAEVLDPVSGRRIRLQLPYGTFAETIRKLMYAPGPARTIPFLIHRAHQGDYRPLVRAALADRRNSAQSGWGLFLALTCSEDVPFIDMARAADDNGRTLLGDYRVRQQAQACAGWPLAHVPASYHEPLHSDIPTIVVSGALDPVTPAANGALVASTLPNAVHVVIPGGAHGPGGMQGAACVDSLVQAFVRQASGAGLDVQSCVGRLRPPPFVLDVPEAAAVDQAHLQRLAGAYASANPPLALRVEALEGHIRVAGEGIDDIGTPLSPTRFRLGNGADLQLEFAADASTLTVHTPGGAFVLTRQP